MAFALIFVGILLTVSAVRGTYSDLFKLVQSDFTGKGNFLYWAVVVIIIGGIGYIPALRTISRALLVVIVLAVLFSKHLPGGTAGGFFSQFISELNTTQTATPNTSLASTTKAATSILPQLPSIGGLNV